MTGRCCTILAGFTAVYGSTVWGGWQISRGAESCEKQDRSIREVTRRGAKNTFALSAKGCEEQRRTQRFSMLLRDCGEHKGTHKGCRYGGMAGAFGGDGRGHPQGVPLRGGLVVSTRIQVGGWFGVLTSSSGWRGPSTQTSPSLQFSCFQMGTISLRRSMA